MSKDVPLVSIGLAVYNGEHYIREAIESILTQTFTDFELIISDNASTDNTAQICLDYAANDERISYRRNEINIGGANNENLTFKLSRGKYFRWAAHDDKLAPSLLEKCVKILENHPEVSLVYTGTINIDDMGNEGEIKYLNKATYGNPSKRFNDLAFRDHNCEPTYGLIRSKALRLTQLQKNYTDSDRVLLCELALRNLFFEIKEPLFFKRYHSKNKYIDWRSRMSWFNPKMKGEIVFPLWSQMADIFYTILKVPLPDNEKLLCYLVFAKWIFINSKRLLKDLLVALAMFFHSREWRIKHAITNWE